MTSWTLFMGWERSRHQQRGEWHVRRSGDATGIVTWGSGDEESDSHGPGSGPFLAVDVDARRGAVSSPAYRIRPTTASRSRKYDE